MNLSFEPFAPFVSQKAQKVQKTYYEKYELSAFSARSEGDNADNVDSSCSKYMAKQYHLIGCRMTVFSLSGETFLASERYIS